MYNSVYELTVGASSHIMHDMHTHVLSTWCTRAKYSYWVLASFLFFPCCNELFGHMYASMHNTVRKEWKSSRARTIVISPPSRFSVQSDSFFSRHGWLPWFLQRAKLVGCARRVMKPSKFAQINTRVKMLMHGRARTCKNIRSDYHHQLNNNKK